MERFNPFANSSLADEDDSDPFGVSYDRGTLAASQGQKPSPPLAHQPASHSDSFGSRYASNLGDPTAAPAATTTNKYSTNFPDPFNEFSGEASNTSSEPPASSDTPRSVLKSDRQGDSNTSGMTSNSQKISNRSSSITFAPEFAHSVDEPTGYGPTPRSSAAASRQASGFSSFLSRATSVTSSSVTDRVSEAVGSVRSAVDSLSTQIQQAVPVNINERITTTASSFIGSSAGAPETTAQQQQQQQQFIQQQQSAASYLASKITSATGKFTSSGTSSSSMPVISRQRVVLVIDSFASADWAQQFSNYRRLTSGASSASQSAITSFFSSATAQLTASSSTNLDGDLVEQADFRDVSVLANQATSTATILISGHSPTSRAALSAKGSLSGSIANNAIARIVRPEYVVVRQRTKEKSDHLRAIVKALNYCLVPMFEPLEIWNIFQDRQLVFAKLLRVQKQLGRENFPLIPQVYCQTHQDLLNHLNSSSVTLPCLMRTGPFGNGKIKIDNLQMLKEFASIMATSGLSCTVERYLEVKCDLVVQKMGTILKLFKKIVPQASETNPSLNSADERISAFGGTDNLLRQSVDLQNQQFGRQSASRQTSLGSSVLSSFISSTTNSANQQGLSRQCSNPATDAYERMSEVNSRYRNWVDGIMREFDNKLEAFCIKIAITNDDREYIVGLTNCSLDFLGNQDNQEEDKRSFVELIISHMNTVLPKTHQTIDHQTNLQTDSMRRTSGDSPKQSSFGSTIGIPLSSIQQPQQPLMDSSLADKKKFISQTQINGSGYVSAGGNSLRKDQAHRNYGQLSSRSQSVSMNQSDYLIDETPINKTAFFVRRGSDRSDSLSMTEVDDPSISQGSQTQIAGNLSGSNLHQRQASLGQSIFDSTSTAFNSLQKQSLSFFKRLDARSSADLNTNTPPQSAKSDRGFERTFVSSNSNEIPAGCNARAGFKSQSMDCSTLERSGSMREGALPRRTPPKPPPPQATSYRQSSLVAHSARREAPNATPHSTPDHSRQNSSATDPSLSSAPDGASQRGKIVRQNSALSAFEKLESELAASANKITRTNESSLASSRANQMGSSADSSTTLAERLVKPFDSTKRSVNFDSASITSGDSNSTGETTTAEDTMNNLKKTFASIFGDKCE